MRFDESWCCLQVLLRKTPSERNRAAGGDCPAAGERGCAGAPGAQICHGSSGQQEGHRRVARGRCRSRVRCNGGGRHRRGQNGYCLEVDLSTSTQAWPVMITPLPGPFLTLTLS